MIRAIPRALRDLAIVFLILAAGVAVLVMTAVVLFMFCLEILARIAW